MFRKYSSSTVVILKTALFMLSCIGGGVVAPRISDVFVSPGPVQWKTLDYWSYLLETSKGVVRVKRKGNF